jgi:hypothetical protein
MKIASRPFDEKSITKTLPKKRLFTRLEISSFTVDCQRDKNGISGIYPYPWLLGKQTIIRFIPHMKNPADYLSNRVFEARKPRRELQPVVAYADAVQAIEQALADAEKYKYLLMRALRRHHDESVPATSSTPAPATPETRVLPLYPEGLPLAA